MLAKFCKGQAVGWMQVSNEKGAPSLLTAPLFR